VGPKTVANPKPTRAGKTGGGGGEAPSRGEWGVSPQIFSKRGQTATISNKPASGTQNPGNSLAHGGGRKGSAGGKSPRQGELGVSPQVPSERGKPPALAICQRVGPKNRANPKPKRVGKTKGPCKFPLELERPWLNGTTLPSPGEIRKYIFSDFHKGT